MALTLLPGITVEHPKDKTLIAKARFKRQVEVLKRFSTCRHCALHAHRKRVAVGKGVLPCDMLLIGEGPGRSENLVGRPFVGPAGCTLNKAIASAQKCARLKTAPSMFFTNIVACRPCDSKRGANREPTDEESWACWKRLETIIRLARPKKIILLGKTAQHFLTLTLPEAIHLPHPSFFTRQGDEYAKGWLAYVKAFARIFKEVV